MFSEKTVKKLKEIDAKYNIPEDVNGRYYVYECITTNKKNYQFIIWIGKQWREWAIENKKPTFYHSEQDHIDFNKWLFDKYLGEN